MTACVEDCRNPSPRLRAAAKAIYDEGLRHGWFSPHFKKTYEEFEKTDPVGFEEFNELVAGALAAADLAS